MRLLVVHPPLSLGRDFVDYPYASDLGAVQLAGVLRERHEVRLLDALAMPGASVAPRPDGRNRLGVPAPALLGAASEGGHWDAAVVALTPFHRPPGRDDLLGEILAGLRAARPEAALLLADCHQSGQHYLEAPGDAVMASYPEADAWVKYEAEVAVPELLQGPPGRPRERRALAGAEADLGDLPEPAWDLADLPARDALQRQAVERLGRGQWPFPIDGRTLPLVTSRGCPWDCLHCSSNPGRAPGRAKAQRRLPPERLRRLCESLVRRHGATRLFALDEMLNASQAHLGALLDAVEALGVGLEIPNGLRADRLDRAAVARLRGRITTLSVSAESGSQRVVDEVVGKRLDLREVERVAADCRAEGLPLMIHWIIGLPGERPEEVNATLEMAADLEARFGAAPAVQFATPLPGTRLAALCGAPRLDDWGPAFQARPSPTDPLVPPEALARFAWAFERRPRPRGAEKLILNLTYRCNNHCVFCAVGNRVRRDGDPEGQRRVLEEHRRRGVELLDLDGGEPTLHRGLLPLLRHAAALGYRRIAVTTNGRLLSYPRFAERLARSGATTILVSLHGPDEATQGRITGVPESFGQTVEGIRNLVAAAPPGLEVGVNTTVARDNAGRLGEMAELVHSLGVRWLNFQFLTPFGRATRAHAPDMPAAAQAVAGVIDRWHPRLRIGVANLPFCHLPGYEAFLSPDLGKRGRHMVFVGDEEVNLAAWLAARRVKRSECVPCPYAACCDGFYEMEDVPEPPWSVPAERASAPRAATISPSPKRAR